MAQTRGSIPPSSSSSDWSAISSDLLYLISARLASGIDYARLRSVCSAWRSAVPERPHPLFLVGRHKGENSYSFRGISADARLRPIPTSAVSLGADLCGSSCGWMAYIDPISSGVTLFNPVTNSQIQLPPFHSQMDDIELSNINAKDLPRFPYKIILSSDPWVASDCVVMILSRWGIAFCRPGDDAWILPAESYGWYYVEETTCAFYDGRFFIFSTEFMACRVGADTVLVEEIYPAGACFDVKAYFSYGEKRVDKKYYLVESAGDLLWVTLVRKGELWDAEVYRFDFQEQPRLLRVKRLGDRALFLGGKQSFSFSAGEFPACKGNHIYVIQSGKTTVINLKDGSYEILCSDLADTNWYPCAWFAPRLE